MEGNSLMQKIQQQATWPGPGVPRRVATSFIQEQYPHGFGRWRGDFWAWNGVHWRALSEEDVRNAVYQALDYAYFDAGKEKLEPWRPNKKRVGDVLDAAKGVCVLPDIDAPFWISEKRPAPNDVVLRNGILNLDTGELNGHTPDLFTMNALDFDYDPAKPEEPTRWISFLKSLWPEDQQSIDTLQETIGYLLAPNTSQQKIFLLVGPPRSGKGTILRVLKGLLGSENVAAPTLSWLSKDFGMQGLIGKSLATISDAHFAGAERHVACERLLVISGEDFVTIPRKYREEWEGQLNVRFVIATNEVPKLPDSSGALAARFVPMVLKETFLGREDPGLTAALQEERAGIFSWGLEGRRRLLERGRFEIPDSGLGVKEMLGDLGSPVAAFIGEVCVTGMDQSVSVSDLWATWTEWCEETKVPPGTKASFGRDLAAAAPSVKKTRPGNKGARWQAYEGIGLLPKEEEASGSGSKGNEVPGLRIGRMLGSWMG